MTKSGRFGRALRSLSPVSPTTADLDAALDVLNNSIDSRILTELTGSRIDIGNDDATVRMSEPSPTLVTDDFSDKDTSVLIKCQSLIDELQNELDAQRKRNGDLESELKKTRSDLEASKVSLGCVTDLEMEVTSLKQQLAEAHQVAKKKDVELENMTRHCERRLEEMKRQLKQNSTQSSFAAAPIPVTGKAEQEEMRQLRTKLKFTESMLSSQNDEMKSVVDSYERQLHVLRDQLEKSQTFFQSYYAVKAKGCDNASSQRSNPFRDY